MQRTARLRTCSGRGIEEGAEVSGELELARRKEGSGTNLRSRVSEQRRDIMGEISSERTVDDGRETGKSELRKERGRGEKILNEEKEGAQVSENLESCRGPAALELEEDRL